MITKIELSISRITGYKKMDFGQDYFTEGLTDYNDPDAEIEENEEEEIIL